MRVEPVETVYGKPMSDPAGPLSFPIRTERLLLRPWAEIDVEAALPYYSDPEVVRYLLHEVLDRTAMTERVAMRRESIAPAVPGDVLSLAVEHEGALIGDLMLRMKDGEPPATAEIGWVFNPTYADRGFATEAASALIDLGFEHYRLHRIFAMLDPRNDASTRLCERLGMTREAHHRRDFWTKGEWTDTYVYAVLVEEWDLTR